MHFLRNDFAIHQIIMNYQMQNKLNHTSILYCRPMTLAHRQTHNKYLNYSSFYTYYTVYLILIFDKFFWFIDFSNSHIMPFPLLLHCN